MSQPAANCVPLQRDTAIPHDIQGTDTAGFNIYTCDDILILTAAAERGGFYLDRHDGLQLMRC